MKSEPKPKKTPAIKRAAQRLDQSLAQLQTFDLYALQQQLQNTALPTELKGALTEVLTNLCQLAQAESLRDSGGKQADMFSSLKPSEFAACMRPMNQRTLF